MTMTKKVKLPYPFKRDDVTVEEVEVRKPFAGELRGLSLTDVVEMKFDAHMVLIPRVTSIDEREVLNLEPANLTMLMTSITGFFVKVDTQAS